MKEIRRHSKYFYLTVCILCGLGAPISAPNTFASPAECLKTLSRFGVAEASPGEHSFLTSLRYRYQQRIKVTLPYYYHEQFDLPALKLSPNPLGSGNLYAIFAEPAVQYITIWGYIEGIHNMIRKFQGLNFLMTFPTAEARQNFIQSAKFNVFLQEGETDIADRHLFTLVLTPSELMALLPKAPTKSPTLSYDPIDLSELQTRGKPTEPSEKGTRYYFAGDRLIGFERNGKGYLYSGSTATSLGDVNFASHEAILRRQRGYGPLQKSEPISTLSDARIEADKAIPLLYQMTKLDPSELTRLVQIAEKSKREALNNLDAQSLRRLTESTMPLVRAMVSQTPEPTSVFAKAAASIDLDLASLRNGLPNSRLFVYFLWLRANPTDLFIYSDGNLTHDQILQVAWNTVMRDEPIPIDLIRAGLRGGAIAISYGPNGKPIRVEFLKHSITLPESNGAESKLIGMSQADQTRLEQSILHP